VHHTGVHLTPRRRAFRRRAPRRRASIGVHLAGVHLAGVHLAGVHLAGVHLAGYVSLHRKNRFCIDKNRFVTRVDGLIPEVSIRNRQNRFLLNRRTLLRKSAEDKYLRVARPASCLSPAQLTPRPGA
jgi:hypothetical protein